MARGVGRGMIGTGRGGGKRRAGVVAENKQQITKKGGLYGIVGAAMAGRQKKWTSKRYI